MKKIITAFFFSLVLVIVTISEGDAQTTETTRTAVMHKLTKYLNEGFADSAATFADSNMNHPDFTNDQEFWFYRGMINKVMYNKYEKGVPKSSYRKKSTLSFQKSLEIPGDSVFTKDCRKNLKYLATTYHNDAVLLLREEKASIALSIYLYEKYIEIMSRIDEHFNVKENEIEFSNALCPVYSRMFENEKDIHANEYYELAKNCYKKVLTLDPTKNSARYNLVVLETNFKTKNERLLKEEAVVKDREIVSLNAVKELAEAKLYESQLKEEAKKKELIVLKKEKEKNELLQQAEIDKQKQLRNSIIIGGILLLLLTVLIYGNFKTKRRHRLEKQMMEFEQKALRSQMNPHFIFNSMNSIQSFIARNDSAAAGNFLSRFARLMRTILVNSRDNFISLDDEMKMLEDYIELEKLRFNNKFDYAFKVQENIDPENTRIPSMFLQPYIENAIIHGISSKEAKGHIEIRFSLNQKKQLVCEIEDDGVGREKAKEIKAKMGIAHQSLAMSLITERLEIINRQNKTAINMFIFDLKDNVGNPSGTRVVLTLPFQEIT